LLLRVWWRASLAAWQNDGWHWANRKDRSRTPYEKPADGGEEQVVAKQKTKVAVD